MDSSALINVPEFYRTTQKLINHTNELIFPTFGISGFRVIIQAFNEADEPAVFPLNSMYQIYVANEYVPPSGDSYYDQMIAPNLWILLREVKINGGSQITNSCTSSNSGIYGSPIDFQFIKISIDSIPNVWTQLIVGTR